jgi:phage gp16-like protein
MRAATTPTDTLARTQVKLIQIGRRALQLDDATYRRLLAELAGGKTSSTALTAEERRRVLDHMKARGFEIKPRAGRAGHSGQGWQRDPQLGKLRAMWYVLADAGEVDAPADMAACNAAIEAWAKRQINGQARQELGRLDALRFATGAQMDKLIESMKAWLDRLGLPNH